ncbi:MAG: hypothetical protein HY064_07820 [Bacteroidetes bacterium]|nr:hypothetical protein [Bacteroidota bacterium]
MNFGFLINYKINNMKSENGVIYTWNGSDTIADTYSTNENGITRGKKFDYNYTYSSSIFPGGSSHFTNTLNKNAFRLFDPEIILGIGLEWNMNDRFSIPFDFVYYKGFRDVKNLTAQVIGSTYNPPPVTGNYWTAQYDVANPFINSCLNFEIGLIYKFSSKKTN